MIEQAVSICAGVVVKLIMTLTNISCCTLTSSGNSVPSNKNSTRILGAKVMGQFFYRQGS